MYTITTNNCPYISFRHTHFLLVVKWIGKQYAAYHIPLLSQIFHKVSKKAVTQWVSYIKWQVEQNFHLLHENTMRIVPIRSLTPSIILSEVQNQKPLFFQKLKQENIQILWVFWCWKNWTSIFFIRKGSCTSTSLIQSSIMFLETKTKNYPLFLNKRFTELKNSPI